MDALAECRSDLALARERLIEQLRAHALQVGDFELTSGARAHYYVDAELQEVSKKSVGVLKDMGPEIRWLHSYVTGDKIYCVYLAPDQETVREHARRGGFPANRISAVRRLIDPNTAN